MSSRSELSAIPVVVVVYPPGELRERLCAAARSVEAEPWVIERPEQIPQRHKFLGTQVVFVDPQTWINGAELIERGFREAAVIVVNPAPEDVEATVLAGSRVPEAIIEPLTEGVVAQRIGWTLGRGPMVVPIMGGEVRVGERMLVRDGQRRRMAPKEALLFEYLARRPTLVIPKGVIVREVWGPDSGVRTLYSTLNRLRQKLERLPERPAHLLTRRGGGYAFHPKSPEFITDPLARAASPVSAVEVFVGRDQQVSKVISGLGEAGLVTVCGSLGVGKTGVLERVSDRLRRLGQIGSVIRCDLRGAASQVAVLREVARATATDISACADTHAAVAKLAQGVGEGDLWVLDHADAGLSSVALLVRRARHAASDLKVLVGACEPLRVAGELRVCLGPLSDDAVERWRQRAGLAAGDWLAACAGHPGVIALASEAGVCEVDVRPVAALDAAGWLMASLSPESLWLLVRASVFARRPDARALAAIVGPALRDDTFEERFGALSARPAWRRWDRSLLELARRHLHVDPNFGAVVEAHAQASLLMSASDERRVWELDQALFRAFGDASDRAVDLVEALDDADHHWVSQDARVARWRRALVVAERSEHRGLSRVRRALERLT